MPICVHHARSQLPLTSSARLLGILGFFPTMMTSTPSVTPAVSVVIPTRDRLPFLQGAIGSMFAQVGPQWECTIVDDASRDGTEGWLSELRDPRISVIRSDRHIERSAARNLGLAQARARYVLFLDDDDQLLPGALDRLLSAAQGRATVGAIGATMLFDGSGNHRRIAHPHLTLRRSIWKEVVMGWSFNCGSTILRTDLVRSVGGFREGMNVSEDNLLWMQLAEHGRFAIVPSSTLARRVHARAWMPSDPEETDRRMRKEYIGTLDEVRRRTAEPLDRTRELLASAVDAYMEGRWSRSLRSYREAIRLGPECIRSPVMGPMTMSGLTRAMTGAAIGRRGVDSLRAANLRARSLFGRAPTAQGGDPVGDIRPPR